MRLDKKQLHAQLSTLDHWQLDNNKALIWQDFRFDNFHQTMDFVNAVANVAHAENHHPDMEVGYNHCLVKYTTHSLAGLGAKDFICARRVDTLVKKS